MAEQPETATAEPAADADRGWLVERQGIDAAGACIGSKLDDAGGGSVGRVEAVLIDAVDGATPTWLVVRLGRFGKRAAVPFDYTAAGVGRVWTPFARETIRAASELDPTAGFSAADERALAGHYGVPEGSGRLAAIAARDEEDPGSVPA